MIEKLGPYNIQRVLGSGGMGTVYAGAHEETGQVVAIKVLSRVLGSNAAFRERFTAEVETLKKLEHPNVVTLYGYGEEDGQLFYSMELVEGGSLQDQLQAGHRFNWQQVTKIAIQVCQALKHAHDYGVVHRDLKPANLMLTADGDVKLSDFGIAKLFGRSQITAAGSVIGTADYMSPEQADGRPATHRSDLYSLGSVMYALIARRPPFAGGSVPDVIHRLKYSEPPPISRYSADIPDELERIIHQLLEKKPEDRFANAYVLSNCLRAMEHGLNTPTQVTDEEPLEARDSGEATLHEGLGEGQQSATREDRLGTEMRPTIEYDVSNAVGDTPIPIVPGQPTRLDQGPEEQLPADDTENRFTEVDQNERRRAQQPATGLGQHEPGSSWRLIVGPLMLIVVALAIWWANRPLSADRLFAQIQAAADSDDVQQLSAVKPKIDAFLRRFPDDSRQQQVLRYKQKVELNRYTQRLKLRVRRLEPGEIMLPAEQIYIEARQLEALDPEAAAQKLAALVDMFAQFDPAADEATARCVEMARRHLSLLTDAIAQNRQAQRGLIARQLDEAQALSDQDPDTAARIAAAIATLYADKAWADDLIQRARTLTPAPPTGNASKQVSDGESKEGESNDG